MIVIADEKNNAHSKRLGESFWCDQCFTRGKKTVCVAIENMQGL
jgi:hypothetical protein